MDELLQKIDIVFNEQKLLGNYDFTEDEYSLMLDNVGQLCRNLLDCNIGFETNHHKLIFTTLVELTKRWKDSSNENDTEDNSRFWDYISKYLVGDENINQRLYGAFIDIISQIGSKQLFPTVLTGKRYYSTLMMHSFAPKNSIFSFFDLCYNIFKKDLDYSFTKEDEWLCELVAIQMKTVLGGGYREDRKVSIGSSAYSIKIGLRSFSQIEELSADFEIFIRDTFYNINKLFNREPVNQNTRLEHYILEWWKNKTEQEKTSEGAIDKKRTPTVSKIDFAPKYLRDENLVYLYIPSIRLDGVNDKMWLTVYVEGEQVRSEEMRTKRGELVVATKQIEFELNDLLRYCNTIEVRVKIKENDLVIFDSERNKTTSLNREFILFEGEKEILSQIHRPTNYFVYSKDIDVLKSTPSELSTFGTNLYNIYPKAGESLIGVSKQVFFADKTKTESLGRNACLIGGLLDVEWHLDNISCVVHTKSVKLMIPENANLKALELRINNKAYKLQYLNYERKESNCYQFGLNTLGLIPEGYPTNIILYSYDNETTILSESIIVLPNLDVQFNQSFYYGDIERKLTVNNGNERKELTWSIQDNEIKFPLNDGVLLIKVTYLRWRINKNNWHKEAIKKKLWYQDILANGDLLEVDCPIENENLTIFGEADGKSFQISRNQSGMYEIGRAIYSNEGKRDVSIYFICGKDCFKFFTVGTKPHFIMNPLSYNNGKVFWNAEDAFIGDKTNEFFLIIKSAENNLRTRISCQNSEIKNLLEDVCKVQIKIKNENIFSKAESYQLIFEGELLIGSPEKLKFKNKMIILLSAKCFNSKPGEWVPFIPKYFINRLNYIEENENIYYIGQLCVIDQNGEKRVLNTMKNETGTYDKTNPVRIELRDNSTLWLVAGWEGGNDFIGNLFCDKWRKGICNIQKQDNQHDEINLYKYKVKEDV